MKPPPKTELVKEAPVEVERSNEPPVVARLVVEIRSDGSRTIARGAVEDVASGQRTTLEARGDSPLQLALQLARVLTQLPRLGARSAVRGLLGRRRDKPDKR
ncbi:MAG: hypothetical protein IPQ07_35305 [Myxococcales bacterium]|nr:hypothetical protein [Myxococcales bacterium]